jgi:peptidoglycan/xylan/chitin deacetylase (PgdA/CDA1 family)
VEQAVTAGHEIASHSTSHRHLTRLAPAERAYEIAESRRILSSTLGVPVTGFRAPGLRVNHACLAAVRDAGYDYDSSVLAGARRPGDGPYAPLPGQALVELPIPATSRLGLPFHPSYSLVVGDWYFRRSLHAFGRRDSPFILLFHLTDFAEPLEPTRARSWQQRLFTLSHLAASRKRARCAAALDLVKQRYRLATTADLTSYASQPDARGRRTS